MDTLTLIALLSAAYFAWKCWRLGREPVVDAIDADQTD